MAILTSMSSVTMPTGQHNHKMFTKCLESIKLNRWLCVATDFRFLQRIDVNNLESFWVKVAEFNEKHFKHT